MNAEIVKITPELAKEMLSKNMENNRKINARKVSSYVRDIKAGKWQLNGESIKFDTNNVLIDGQHRLTAVVRAGCPITSLVVFGVAEGTTEIDRGVPRSTSHAMQMAGYSKTESSRAIIALVKLHFTIVHNHKEPTDTEVVEYINEHFDQLDTAIHATRLGKDSSAISRKASCQLAAYHAMLSGAPLEKLERFFAVVNSGFSDSRTESAAIVARNYLISTKGAVGNGGYTERMTTYKIFSAAIKDFLNGTPRKVVYRTTLTSPYLDRVKAKEGVGRTSI